MYHFNCKVRVGQVLVAVDTDQDYGYAEHDTYGELGGLWLDDGALVDSDGVATLPRLVATALHIAGVERDPAEFC